MSICHQAVSPKSSAASLHQVLVKSFVKLKKNLLKTAAGKIAINNTAVAMTPHA